MEEEEGDHTVAEEDRTVAAAVATRESVFFILYVEDASPVSLSGNTVVDKNTHTGSHITHKMSFHSIACCRSRPARNSRHRLMKKLLQRYISSTSRLLYALMLKTSSLISVVEEEVTMVEAVVDRKAATSVQEEEDIHPTWGKLSQYSQKALSETPFNIFESLITGSKTLVSVAADYRKTLQLTIW